MWALISCISSRFGMPIARRERRCNLSEELELDDEDESIAMRHGLRKLSDLLSVLSNSLRSFALPRCGRHVRGLNS